MSEPRIVVRPTEAEVAAAAAEQVATEIEDAVTERGIAHWVTTGGSAPGGIYRAIVTSPLATRVPWRNVHLWWGDDRFVPSGHPESNVKAALDILLGIAALSWESGTGGGGADVGSGRLPGVPIPASQVHPMPTGLAIGGGHDPDWAAAQYAATIRAAGPPTGPAGLPVFDLVLLGIGPDGHLLSVFPGSAAVERSEWVVGVPAPTHVEPHVARVSLHPSLLDAARQLLVVATGGAKAAVLREILAGDRDPSRLPGQIARREGAVWILDEAAAAELPDRA